MFFSRNDIYGYLKILVLSCFLVFYTGCVDTFEPNTVTFQRLLVVEAIITDETIRHEVLLSRTTPIENIEPSPESDASVMITDDMGNIFTFSEELPGQYISNQEFAALSDRAYTLMVNIDDGTSFISESSSLSGVGEINDVRAVRTVNENGMDGVEIVVDGSGITEGASFFRYEFEETSQIRSPFIPAIDLILVSENPLVLERRFKEEEQAVCYRTRGSNDIAIINTSNISGNTVTNFPVRFIGIDDFMIRSRYSINVKQFVQSREAQFFYEALQDFSDLESLFSQTQPGFIEGNISSVNNSNENVIGFFEVSSVSTRRIFFNFEDIFPDGSRPLFINDCNDMEFSPTDPNFIGLFRTGRFRYVGEDPISGNIFIAIDICVDCTLLGSNIEPDFWEE